MGDLRRFAFRLAKELGEVDVDAMLASIPLRLFNEWIEYAQLEPFGEERADLRAAIVACVTANAWRGKTGRRFQPKDFMPQFSQTRRPRQTAEQMDKVMREFAAAYDIAKKSS